MTCLQEYDIEFKRVHTVKGHGLCRLAAEVMDSPEEYTSGWEEEIKIYNVQQVPPTNATTSCYSDTQQYLEHVSFPLYLSKKIEECNLS